MKLTIKTLHDKDLQFTIEIGPDKNVKELKQLINDQHGKVLPEGDQKLIYAGKILADDNKIEEYNIDEKKFLVLMITRPPPQPKPKAPDTPQVTKKAPEGPTVKEETKQQTRATASSAATAATTSTPADATTGATIASAPVGATTTTASSTTTTARAASLNTTTGGQSRNLERGEMNAHLGQFAHHQFREIQDLIQQSPHLLSATIERLAATDPEMYTFISENPDVFVNALNRPPSPGSRPSTTTETRSTRASNQGGQQQSTRDEFELPLEDVMRYSQVQRQGEQITENDKEAIERLKGMGFPEILAVQAYIACDKDEQLAANLLCQMDQ